MTATIREWLQSLGLDRYADAFEENDLDMDLVLELTESDLEKLGISSMGHRKKLMRALKYGSDELAGHPSAGKWASGSTEASASEPSIPTVQVERRQLSILFCDLVGSTELSQRIEPEKLREIMRRYQDAVAGAISRYGGHVAKYLGDGVLAYFGWPHAREDQAERAVWAGIEAAETVGTIPIEGNEFLRARVGIETGQVIVGDLIGVTAHDPGAVSGETPNLAARLHELAKPGHVAIGPSTRRLIREAFDLHDLGAQRLKGFSEPVHVWVVKGQSPTDSRFSSQYGSSISRLFGREHELGLLLDRWAQCKSDGGQIVTISGEPGIGKSRLVHALREQTTSEDYFLLRYQCSPHHSGTTLYPIVQRLERSAGFQDGDSDDDKLNKLEALLAVSKSNLEEQAPFFGLLLKLDVETRYQVEGLEPRQIREGILEALIRQLLDLARLRPVLFVLEDAHWVDPTTEELLSRLFDAIAESRVFLILTHRPEYILSFPKPTYLTSIALNRISQAQAAILIETISDGKLNTDVMDRIAARADGVPLYLEELTRSVLDSITASSLQTQELTIPESLHALLASRLDTLGPAKEIAQIGAVIGREFSRQLIGVLARRSANDLAEQLDQLIQSGLVFRRGAQPKETYVFKHALIQDAAYDGLLLSRRSQMHGQVVEQLERIHSANLEEAIELLAFHSQRAELWEKSVSYCHRAGQIANEQSAYREALTLLEAGLEAAERIPRNEENLRAAMELRLSMRPSLGALGLYPRFLEVLTQVEQLARSLGDNTTIAHASVERTHVLYHSGHGTEAVELGRQAVALANSINSDRLVIAAEANLGMALFYHGQPDEACQVASAHIDDLRTRFRRDQLGTTSTSSVNYLANLAAMHALLGKFAAAQELAEEALGIAHEIGKSYDIAMAGHWNGFIHVSRGDAETAINYLDCSSEIINENGLEFLYPWASIHLGSAYSLADRHEDAVQQVISAAQKADQLGLTLAQDWASAVLARVKNRSGQFDQAAADASLAVRRARQHGFHGIEQIALQELGRAKAGQSNTQTEEAIDHFTQAIALAERLGFKLYLAEAHRGLGEVYIQTGVQGEARACLARAKDLFSLMGLDTAESQVAAAINQLQPSKS